VKRGYIYAGLIGTLLALLWVLRGCQDRKIDAGITTPTLQADEQAKIIFNQNNHTVTRLDSTGTHRTFLNPHGPVAIVEKKDGRTVLIQRTWGTEHSPFVGVALGSDIRGRAALGLDLFYVQRWELGGGLLLNTDIRDTRLFAHVSYNAYDNVYVSLGVDNKRTAHVMAGLKF
jgi:hypothetical protein